MKKAKKLLAVLLVLVLALGMVPFAAAERPLGGFTDANIITDDEAVEVLTAINVLRGRPDGSFDPHAGVTRAEAVVIVARLLLGAAVADGLPSNRTGFPDVDGVSGVGFATGAIAWAVSQGIVVGRPNGNFEPNAPVKASEFAIMILRSVGYGRNGEYTGTHWETNGILNGMTLGILTVEDINFQDNANREQIARYAFNALNHEDEAHLLRYVDWSADISNYTISHLAFKSIFTRIHENAVIPLTFENEAIRDDLGRPSIEWMIGDEVIGVYARKLALLYTSFQNATDMTRNLRGYTLASPSSVYINGTNNASLTSIPTLTSGNFETVIANLTENGYRVEIYTRPFTRVITDVIVVRTFLGEVMNINPAARQFVFENVSSPASLSETTFGVNSRITLRDIDQEDLYAAVVNLDLKVRDRVVVTAAWDGTQVKVVEVVVPDTVVGPIAGQAATTSWPGARALTVGGNTYRLSMAHHVDVWATGTTANAATLLLDAYGFVIDIKDGSVADTPVLMVLDFFHQIDLTTGRSAPMARGVLPNGEVVEVRVRQHMSPADAGIYAVTDISGGIYTLAAAPLSTVSSLAPTTATNSNLIRLLDTATMTSATMSLSTTFMMDAVHDPLHGGTFFATDVKFFYYHIDTNSRELTYTVREGLHTTPNNNNGASYAVIEYKVAQQQNLVTAVYLRTFDEDASGLVFVNTPNRVERQSDGTDWTYMNVYRDGVLEVIPFQNRPTSGQFHNIVRLSTGAYQSAVQFNANAVDNYPVLGTHPRLFVGTVSSTTSIINPDAARLNIIQLVAGVDVNITNATVIDLRPPTQQSPIEGYPITASGRGIVSAMDDDNKTVGVGIQFADNTRVASVIYITSATPWP